MSQPIVYGPAFSTYVRSTRLALAEKGVDHELHEVDMLSGKHKEAEHLSRQPFGKVPAFEHDGHKLYEAGAIMRYVDDAFDGPSLTPETPYERARMTQVLSIVDSYGWTPCIQGVFIPRVLVPMQGGTTDEAAVSAAAPAAKKFVEVLEGLLGDQPYFVGEELTLADLHVFPILTYLAATPEGQEMLSSAPNLNRWMASMAVRQSVQQMMPPQ